MVPRGLGNANGNDVTFLLKPLHIRNVLYHRSEAGEDFLHPLPAREAHHGAVPLEHLLERLRHLRDLILGLWRRRFLWLLVFPLMGVSFLRRPAAAPRQPAPDAPRLPSGQAAHGVVAGGVGGAARTVGAGHLGVDFQLALLLFPPLLLFGLLQQALPLRLRDGLGVAPAVGGFPAFLKHPQARGEVGLDVHQRPPDVGQELAPALSH
mmetsp:Transcript_40352/g.96260  ORF Transcript_40352/g.96260 Transcript_40352/m.96260 type:complete len:208 (+) Transcript_40352:2281-2904(+)